MKPVRRIVMTVAARVLAAVATVASCSDGAGHDSGEPGSSSSLAHLVDPFIGTGGIGWGVGSTFPGACVPFGMVKLSPDTTTGGFAPGFAHCGGYWWADSEIRGFSHTHMSGTGVADYGNILVMPRIGFGDEATVEAGYRSAFRHETESATPGHYAVTLEPSGIRVDLTATERAGLHRYTFPSTGDPFVLVDVSHTLGGGSSPDGEVEVDPAAGRISGWMWNLGDFSRRSGGFAVHFAARLHPLPRTMGVWKDGRILSGATSTRGSSIGAFAGFPPGGGGPVLVKVGISYVSVEQARLNLETEIPGWNFGEVRGRARRAWEGSLGAIEIEGGGETEREIFATALYHSLLMPTLFTDANGSYRGFDGLDHEAEGFLYYTDFSLWDTYRTLHPLLILLEPLRQRDMMTSLARMYEQGGYVPRWPLGTGYTGSMVGSSADIVIAETYLKGIRDFDVETAYEGIRAIATAPAPPGAPYGGRAGIESYMALGYVPAEEVGDSVSWTLEMSYDDFAIGRLAAALGKDEDRRLFEERAKSYRNLWDPSTAFFRGRNRDGSWLEPFGPLDFGGPYTEGNAWHWLWLVPYDAGGLAALAGGPAALVRKLDTFFQRSSPSGNSTLPALYYWHGNEPDIHAAFLYALAGRPDLTQRWARWVMDTRYGTGPDGLAGNDDAGTLSAWYVFAALGLFPIAGDTRYVIGSPVFQRAAIRLDGGQFTIEAPGASPENRTVGRALLDGHPLDAPWIEHDDIVPGSTLFLEMGPD